MGGWAGGVHHEQITEQVGVNAPGTETSTTFLPENNSSVDTAPGPESVITPKVPLGILSPACMVMQSSWFAENGQAGDEGNRDHG